MEIKIKYPTAKCSYCGKPYTKQHNRQMYCSDYCREHGYREKTNRRWRKWYRKNKNRLYQKQLGTRTIGPKPNPDIEKEHEIVTKEKQRTLNF